MTSQVALTAALEYASRGLRVLPVCPAATGCSSRTCKKGKHPLPAQWQKRASSDAEEIRKWFAKYPTAGVGIATGPGSGVFVLDVDGDEGQASLQELVHEHGSLPYTLTAVTGRGGRHLYFRYPDVKVVTRSKVRPSLDVRGHGGFVVAPPSPHVSGNNYQWIDASTPIAEPPRRLIEFVSAAKSPAAESNVNILGEENLVIKKGERHPYLVHIGGGLRANGKNEQEILEHLIGLNEDVCEEPLPIADVKQIAASISRYPAEHAPSEPGKESTKLPWFPFDVDEWLGDHLLFYMDAEQRAWYWTLAFESWKTGGVFENNPDKLWRIARASSKTSFEAKQDDVLAAFDKTTDEAGRSILTHPRIEAIWLHQAEAHAAKVAGGKKRAQQRRQVEEGKQIDEEKPAA